MLQYSYYEPQLISYQAVRDATEETFNAIMQGDGTNIKALLDQLTEKANQLQAEQLK
jgi:multiple sugar transport system substrate-binding protein/sn-glycerol 3-phosphate transport system substrate-binding protein